MDDAVRGEAGLTATEGVAVGLCAAIVSVAEGMPRILVLDDSGIPEPALPSAAFLPDRQRTLEEGLRDLVEAQTGLALGHVEQLYAFADRWRDPRELSGAPRMLSVGYLALVRPASGLRGGVRWQDLYALFPWEDRRRDEPARAEMGIRPRLRRWRDRGDGPAVRRGRAERVAVTFGETAEAWDAAAVLERYELLYECELVAEARRDAWQRAWHTARAVGAGPPTAPPPVEAALGPPMVLDHRRIAATALGRLRARLAHRPLLFELMPPSFTLLQLQTVAEALTGEVLHKQNFRRLVLGGLVEPTGAVQATTGGRPAALFRFRREVLRERPAPGVGLPGLRRSG
ncbi:MAG: NUDIX hydrolase [Alphaproteobacteria bacterium]